VLYFITYPDWEGHWHKYYNSAVESELRRRDIDYRRFTTDYSSPSISDTLQQVSSIESRQTDTWLFSSAQNPAIELVEHRPGGKYGHVHGMECFPFEPALLQGISLEEERRFGYYNHLFFSSLWAQRTATRTYPQYTDRFTLTGFPMDYRQYDPYTGRLKHDDLVVFNQRLSCERLPTLEIELSRQLLLRGYSVWHLYPAAGDRSISGCPLSPQLMRIAEASGMRFVPNQDKDDYHKNLARAEILVTTSICDALPVGVIEGIYMGAVPVVPNAMCFPEFVNPDNRYRPYDMGHILEIIRRRPLRSHGIEQYEKQRVLDRYMRVMF